MIVSNPGEDAATVPDTEVSRGCGAGEPVIHCARPRQWTCGASASTGGMPRRGQPRPAGRHFARRSAHTPERERRP